jgi:uncharacterized protein DUF1731
MGARILGTEPELVLKSRWSAPGRLLEEGFTFELGRWQDAAADLCGRWREAKGEDVAAAGTSAPPPPRPAP